MLEVRRECTRVQGAGVTRCDEYPAVGQQHRPVSGASDDEATGLRPTADRRIVEFRAGGGVAAALSACDEHLAVGQQRRRELSARRDEVTGVHPSSDRWIVEFRAHKKA